MSDWKKDKGQTTLPCIYIPFNECESDAARSNIVPCRVGYTTIRAMRSSYVNGIVDNKGHISFSDADSITNMGRFRFGNPIPAVPASRHDLVLSPHLNIGKHIFTSFKLKMGAEGGGNYRNIIYINRWATTGGYGIELAASSGMLRQWIRAADGSDATSVQSATGIFVPAAWQQVYLSWHVESATKMTCRVWVADAAGNLVNGGNAVITQVLNLPVFNLSVDSIATFLGFDGGASLDIKDWLSVVSPDDPSITDGLMMQLRAWYANPDNEYQFPDFLRAPVDHAALRRATHYCSYWTLDGNAASGKAITSMYDFWLAWGIQNSAFDGIHLGLGINAFQPAAGAYLITELRAFADWCHSKGIKLAVMVNDQAYTNGQNTEVPDHFPNWKTRPSGTETRRVAMYWDEIDTFELDTEIFQNPYWATYNAARAGSGTYRWFHHVWTLVNALKDKPAFSGITTGETAGNAFSGDSGLGNIAGASNRRGIYGITDNNGIYQLSRCYSLRKQCVALGKLMQMVAHQLRGRSDVSKAVQINYHRYKDDGGVLSFSYSAATQLFTRTNHPFKDGDAVFLAAGSWTGADRGFAYDTIYYVRNVTTNTWQLSLTPDGTIINSFLDVNPANHFVYLEPINVYIERDIEQSHNATIYNGYSLAGQSRALRWLAEDMYQYGFIPSGPDLIASGLEQPYYYLGPVVDGKSGEISVVEALLAMQYGHWIFSDIPLGGAECQSQDSTFMDAKESTLTALLPLYAPYYGTRYSVEQAHRYAIDRLQVSAIVWFLPQIYAQKSLPDLVREISI